jgi:hypothetical protein
MLFMLVGFFLLFETFSFDNVTVTNVTICDSLKAVTEKTIIESFKSPSLAGVFVTICDLVYFYTSLAYSKDLLI